MLKDVLEVVVVHAVVAAVLTGTFKVLVLVDSRNCVRLGLKFKILKGSFRGCAARPEML